MWEKNKGTTECEKRTVTCNVRTAQYEDRTVKCEKKVREPPNVRKKLSHMMLEAQCKDVIIKYEKKVTWYSRLPTSGYDTPPFFLGTIELPIYITITYFRNVWF